jgi:hypothetical protein
MKNRSSETSVNTRQIFSRYVPENDDFHCHRCKNLIPNKTTQGVRLNNVCKTAYSLSTFVDLLGFSGLQNSLAPIHIYLQN